jgi:hypothetical protein
VHREALSEARVLRQPVEALYVHAAAPWVVDPPAKRSRARQRCPHCEQRAVILAP